MSTCRCGPADAVVESRADQATKREVEMIVHMRRCCRGHCGLESKVHCCEYPKRDRVVIEVLVSQSRECLLWQRWQRAAGRRPGAGRKVRRTLSRHVARWFDESMQMLCCSDDLFVCERPVVEVRRW